MGVLRGWVCGGGLALTKHPCMEYLMHPPQH